RIVWFSAFNVPVGGPSFAIASSLVDMPGISSVTLYRLGAVVTVQPVRKSAPTRTPQFGISIARQFNEISGYFFAQRIEHLLGNSLPAVRFLLRDSIHDSAWSRPDCMVPESPPPAGRRA